MNTILNESWLNKYYKVKEVIKEADLVIEIIDARIIKTCFDLYNWQNNEELSKIPRILYLNFLDLCDEEDLKKWLNYFKRKNIFIINEYNCSNIHELKSILLENKIIKKIYEYELLTIGLIGIPKVGKKTFLQNLGIKSKKPINLISGIKNINYNINNEIKILDTISILPINLKEYQLYFLQILDKTHFLNYGHANIAIMALTHLMTYYPNIIKEKYNLKFTNSEFKKYVENNLMINYFKQISVNLNLLNELNMFDTSKAIERFINDIRQGNIKKYNLDIKPGKL